MPLLEVRGLQKSYGGRRVVDGVDLHVGRAEIVGLLGPNGAGKTTTFRMVMGMIRSEAGEVKLGGEDINRLPMFMRARRGMGYLSQEPSIFRNLSVEDNIMAILETQDYDRRERRERLAELLQDLGLSRVSQSMAYQLSGKSLRDQIEKKGQMAPAPRIGRTTRIIRLEEEQHRRQMQEKGPGSPLDDREALNQAATRPTAKDGKPAERETPKPGSAPAPRAEEPRKPPAPDGKKPGTPPSGQPEE